MNTMTNTERTKSPSFFARLTLLAFALIFLTTAFGCHFHHHGSRHNGSGTTKPYYHRR